MAARWTSAGVMVVAVVSATNAVAAEPIRGELGVFGGGWFSQAPTASVVGLTGGVRVGGAVSVSASVGVLPNLSSSGRLVTFQRTDNLPLPLLEPSEQSTGDVTLRFAPILLDVVGWNGRIHLGVGAGVVRTRDDLQAFLAQDDPRYIAVARQWHPTASWTVGFEGPLTRHLAVSAGVTNRYYVETIGVSTELRTPMSLTAAVLWRPYREKRPLHD